MCRGFSAAFSDIATRNAICPLASHGCLWVQNFWQRYQLIYLPALSVVAAEMVLNDFRVGLAWTRFMASYDGVEIWTRFCPVRIIVCQPAWSASESREHKERGRQMPAVDIAKSIVVFSHSQQDQLCGQQGWRKAEYIDDDASLGQIAAIEPNASWYFRRWWSLWLMFKQVSPQTGAVLVTIA